MTLFIYVPAISSNEDIIIAYVPSHLYFVMFELLKVIILLLKSTFESQAILFSFKPTSNY